MYRTYIESLWTSGRRSFADVTVGEFARAVALWCQDRPFDAQDLPLDQHVQDRIAHRLHEYFSAIADGLQLTALSAQVGLSELLLAAARRTVEADIRRHFETNRRLAEFLREIKPASEVAA